MDKRILLAVSFVCACASAAGATSIPSSGTSLGTQAFRPSNNVTIYCSSVAGTPTAPGSYSAASMHASGDRNFGTNSTQSIIYWSMKSTITLTDTSVSATSTGPTLPSYTDGNWSSL